MVEFGGRTVERFERSNIYKDLHRSRKNCGSKQSQGYVSLCLRQNDQGTQSGNGRDAAFPDVPLETLIKMLRIDGLSGCSDCFVLKSSESAAVPPRIVIKRNGFFP